jgi:hypothetical protein
LIGIGMSVFKAISDDNTQVVLEMFRKELDRVSFLFSRVQSYRPDKI